MFSLCAKTIIRSPKYIVYLLMCLLSLMVGLAIPFLTGQLVNNFVGVARDGGNAIAIGAEIAALGIVRAGLNCVSELVYVDLQAHVGFALNEEVISHVQRLPRAFFASFDASYYNQQINHDANDLVIFVITASVQSVSNTVTLLAVFVVLATINGRLAMLCMVLGIISGVIYSLFKKRLFARSFEAQEQEARFFSDLEEQLSNAQFIRRHVLFEVFKQRLERSFAELYRCVYQNQKINATFTFANAVFTSLAQGGILILGAKEVLDGNLLPGYLMTALSYYSYYSSAIEFFLALGKDYQTSKVSYERLRRLLDMPEDSNGTVILDDVHEVSCFELTYKYPGSVKTTFRDIRASFKKGKLYGIVGPNGSGKSTLLDVISGCDPENCKGVIWINNKPLSSLDRYALRKRNIGITEQEPPLTEGSIRENLTLCCGTAEDRDLESLIERMGLKKMVDSSGGLDAELDDKQNNISGGEKQKIAIIRQLLKNPDVMMFDEPTSALDSQSKRAFIEILKERRRRHIMVIATHDPVLISACDEVIEIS